MATTYTLLKQRLLTKLQGISQLQETADEPKLNFSGYPAAYIIPTEGEGDYETSTEDKRIYSFSVYIIYALNADGDITSDAIDAVYDAIDYVLDSFAGDKLLEDDGVISFPTGKILAEVRPVAAGWGTVADGKYISAEVKVNVFMSVDTTV